MKGENINTKERILKEEHAYLEEVAAFLDDNIKDIEIHCENLMEESKLPYAGSTEERRHVQYLRKTVANEREQIRKIENIKENPYFGRMDFNLVEEGVDEELVGEQWIESLHYQIQRIVDVNAKNKKKYSEREVEHANLQISLEKLIEEIKALQDFVEEGKRVYSHKLIKTKENAADQVQKRLKIQQELSELRENQEIDSLQPWETYIQQAKASRVEKMAIQEQLIKMNECFNKRTPDKVKNLLGQLKQEVSDLDNQTSDTYGQIEAQYQILVEKHMLIMKMEEQLNQIDKDIDNTEKTLKIQQEEIENKEHLLKERDTSYKTTQALKVECEDEIIALKRVILSEQIIEELLAFNKSLPIDSRFLESEIYNKLRRSVFKEYKFTYTAKRYKFDLYCLLQLIYLYRGPLRNCDKYLYIDEAQDLRI